MVYLRPLAAATVLGLLEAVPDEALEALADPDDADGDGISGRPNRVWDPQAGRTALGRFGHKANTMNLEVQGAAAYVNDIGVTNRIFSGTLGASDAPELDDETLVAAVFYTQTLAVPARAWQDEPAVRRGEALFGELGCASCHVETLASGPHPVAAVAEQTFHPYTDLLLHDLGEGLADGRPDFEARGSASGLRALTESARHRGGS